MFAKLFDFFIDIYYKLIVRKDDLSGESEEKDYYTNRYNN